MNDQQFAYMTRVIEASTTDGRFNPADVSRDEDFLLAKDAMAHDWIIIEAGSSRVTQKGKEAWLAAKDEREQKAQAAAEEDRKHLRQTKREFRFSLLSAVIGGAITLLIEHLIFGKHLP